MQLYVAFGHSMDEHINFISAYATHRPILTIWRYACQCLEIFGFFKPQASGRQNLNGLVTSRSYAFITPWEVLSALKPQSWEPVWTRPIFYSQFPDYMPTMRLIQVGHDERSKISFPRLCYANLKASWPRGGWVVRQINGYATFPGRTLTLSVCHMQE